jgi:hypothetical protein
MNREVLRQQIVAGIDSLLSLNAAHPFLVPMTAEQREILLGQRQFWVSDLGVALDSVLHFMGEQNMAAKKFNLPAVEQLFKDVVSGGEDVVQIIGTILTDLQNVVGPAAQAKRKGVKKCCDRDICCEAHQTVESLSCALSHAVKVCCCCEDPDNCPPTP